ncbi:hypothetical protein DPMN_000897 [Dreissena polymorpha]|uniref:Uncharacterized protein n=1 Tax=Dreissena polymorpha TaxID=45954 RepID=A0A9D4MG94_DREPO|nr:hypothetical protein DPMN_000897 [Dreissena polymorpha]
MSSVSVVFPRFYHTYKLEVARQRPTRNFGWARPMLVGPRKDLVVIRDVQWGAPRLVMGPCIVEIDRIVIRDVQYQFEFQVSIANIVGGGIGQDERTDRPRR